jgi:hypothetical protein
MTMTLPDSSDTDTALETAASLARTLIPEVQARVEDLKDRLAKAMDQLARLEQIERIASGQTTSDVPAAVALQRKRRREFPDDAAVDDETDAKTTQDDIEQVLVESTGPLTVVEIKDRIEHKLGRKRATSTLYNYLRKGKTAGMYANADDRWSLTEEGQTKALFG